MAECGEYHSLGKYYEGIQTLEEAISFYQQIPPERMNGIPAIEINLHVMGTDKMEDVQEAVKAIIRRFPDKEVIDY